MSKVQDKLRDIRALRDAGRSEEYLEHIAALASERPADVDVRIEAAHAFAALGSDEEAVAHFDAVWSLGVPAKARRRFLVGYGATLRNTGRSEQAVAVLGEAVAQMPTYAPLKVLLALALLSAGHPHAALATALDVLFDVTHDSDELDGYERAFLAYRDELLARAMENGAAQ